jgi:predicted hydrocarbon binding protein
MNSTLRDNGMLGFGRRALHQSRETLQRVVGDDAPACLQEIGSATGEDVYRAFAAWLPRHTAVEDPGELDAARLGEVLSTFFTEMGWGELVVERIGMRGLELRSSDWAEADPGLGATYPTCFLSSGLLADFLTRLAGAPIAIMEVECRSRNDEHCRFFAGSPETLDAAYDAMAQGEDYLSVFGG